MVRHLGPLALLMLAIVPVARADDLFVASTFNTDILRLLSVNASGEMSLHTSISVSNEAFDVSADPYGRFTACATDGYVFLHRVGPGMTLIYADHFEREDYFFSLTMALSPDGRTAVALGGELDAAISSGEAATMSPSDNRFFLKTFTVNNRLQLVETGYEFPIILGTDVSSLVSMAISPIGDSTIILGLPNADDVSFAALHLTPEGEIIDEGARAGDGKAFNTRISLSSDGRYAIADKQTIVLIRVEDDRTLTFVDQIDGLFSDNPQFTPDSNWIVGAGEYSRSLRVNPGPLLGDYVGQVDTPAAESVAVSQDGSYVLVDHQIIGPGDFQIANIHINTDGTLTNTGHALEFGGKHADIVAIPAQTPPTLLGDANDDGAVDAADIVFLINEAMPDDKPILMPQNFANADIDGDIDVDQDDLDALLGMLLGL